MFIRMSGLCVLAVMSFVPCDEKVTAKGRGDYEIGKFGHWGYKIKARDPGNCSMRKIAICSIVSSIA